MTTQPTPGDHLFALIARVSAGAPGSVDWCDEARRLLAERDAQTRAATLAETAESERADVLYDVLAQIGDPARRQQAALHYATGSGLGWESARDVVRLMMIDLATSGVPEVGGGADPWPTVAALHRWLAGKQGTGSEAVGMRLFKLNEEIGEVANAYFGMRGDNPRKGETHAATDVADELCDVALTAMVALLDFTGDPAGHFAGRLAAVAARAGVVADDAPAPDFFRPGRTYISSAYTFHCRWIDTNPHSGQVSAVGWWGRTGSGGSRVHAFGPSSWTRHSWIDVTPGGGDTPAPCGLQCRRCGGTDGPFKGTADDVLCEGCINRGGVW